MKIEHFKSEVPRRFELEAEHIIPAFQLLGDPTASFMPWSAKYLTSASGVPEASASAT
jgi:hypothetical protein